MELAIPNNRIVQVDERIPPWQTVFELASSLPHNSWILIGGLMIQLYGSMFSVETRSTRDIDLLINVLAQRESFSSIVHKIERLGFSPNPPQFRKGSFYRLSREDAAIDVFVADHLPRTRRATFGGGKWRLVETPGGAQAISRSVSIDLKSQNHFARIRIPSILGAIIMKSAVVSPTDPLSEKHLNDIALLASLMEKPVDQRLLLHGSDLQRIKRAARILENPNHPAWLTLPDARRQCGYMNLRILSSPEFHN